MFDIHYSELLATAALIVSIRASMYVRKERTLNIREAERREANERKAHIVVSCKYDGRGSYTVTFSNDGMAEARNINCDFGNLDKSGIIIVGRRLFPYKSLDCGECFKVHFSCTEGHAEVIELTLSWDDDFKTGRTFLRQLCVR